MVFAVSGAFLALTALPGFHWHDTAEFGATARRLALSHSPGHPLHGLTTALFQHGALGDISFRSNLASGLCVALALAIFHQLLRGLAPRAPRWAAVACALAPVLMPALWLQSIRTEVYGLQLLLAACCAVLLWRLAEQREPRDLVLLAFFFGLGGANHSLVGLALIPATLVVMVAVRVPFRALLLSAASGLAGLATYLMLPLRAHAGGVVGWGRPDTIASFWGMVRAKDWAKPAVGGADVFEPIESFYRAAGFAIDQVGVGPAAALFVVVAAGLALGDGAQRRRLAIVALGTFGFFATKFYFRFDLMNPDLGGYFAGGLVGLWACAFISVQIVVERLERLAPQLHQTVWAIFPTCLVVLAPGYDPGGRQGARWAEAHVRALVDETPPDGVLLLSDYASNFGAWHLLAAEGYRPDVALVFRGQRQRDWHRARVLQRHPGAGFAMNGPLPRAPRADVRLEPGVELRRLGPVLRSARPVGRSFAFEGPGASIEDLERAFGRPLESGADIDTRRATAFMHAQHALLILELDPRWRAHARWHLRRATALAGADPALASIWRRLGNDLDGPTRE